MAAGQAESDAINGVIEVAKTVSLTCADIIKYIIDAALERRGQGVGDASAGEKKDSLPKKIAKGIVRHVPGKGNEGQASWRKATGWDDRDTVEIPASITDRENIDTLRKCLREVGVDFAVKELKDGRTLIAYHLPQNDLVSSIVKPLMNEWARAKGVTPSDAGAVRAAAEREGWTAPSKDGTQVPITQAVEEAEKQAKKQGTHLHQATGSRAGAPEEATQARAHSSGGASSSGGVEEGTAEGWSAEKAAKPEHMGAPKHGTPDDVASAVRAEAAKRKGGAVQAPAQTQAARPQPPTHSGHTL